MKLWPWKRQSRPSAGGARALADTERGLEATRDRWHEVLDAAETMRSWDHYNHFAESLSMAYGATNKEPPPRNRRKGDLR